MNKLTSEDYVNRLENFISAVVKNQLSQDVEDSVELAKIRKEFAEYLDEVITQS